MFNFLVPYTGKLLSVLRIVSGLLFFEHGAAKLLQFPVDAAKGPSPVPSLTTLPGIAGVLELVGGALLVLGLFTRPVAFLLSGEMAVAYWTAHAKRGMYPLLNGGDGAILFCFIFLYLVAAGGGEWSADNVLGRRKAA